MDEKKKSSVLRYLAIMFSVAFVLVLISLIGQTRSISNLSSSSASAMQHAEDLQNAYRNAQDELETLKTELTQVQQEKEALQAENKELNEELAKLQQAYDDLQNTDKTGETEP